MTAVDPEGRIRHPLDVFHSTFAPDGSFIASGMVPVADGLGQVDYLDSTTFGSTEVPYDLGNLGSTETIDLANGTYQRGTLNANCTIGATGFTVDEAGYITLKLTQDGTGGWDLTWDAAITFIGDDQPAQGAGTVSFFILWSDVGDSTIFGAPVGGSGVSGGTPAITLSTTNATGSATTAILTDATIAVFDATAPVTQAFGDSAATGSAGTAARRDHKHGMPADPSTSGHYELLMAAGSSPIEPLETGDGLDWLWVWVT